MPALLSITARGNYWLLQAALPARRMETIGVLLHDPELDRLHTRLRRDWLEIANEDEYEALSLLSDDIQQKAEELGAAELMRFLEDTLSNVIQLSSRESVLVSDWGKTLDRLYREHVPARVLRFETHLPRYSLQAAAGRFSEQQDVSEDEWIEVPSDLRLTEDMFVAQVIGRSMEPRIPEGSWCVFKAGVIGSREGRLVLVANYAESDTGGRYTIKRYHSEKVVDSDGWRHARIDLQPLNPEYEAWELDDSGTIAVIAEFVRVL